MPPSTPDYTQDSKLIMTSLDTANANIKALEAAVATLRIQVGVLAAKQVIYAGIGTAVMYAFLKGVFG